MQTLLLFLPEILGTFLGALLGVATALWIENRRDHNERLDQGERMIESLVGEIDLLTNTLKAATKPSSDEDLPTRRSDGAIAVTLNFYSLPHAAFDSAVNGGGFALFPADLQVALSRFYEFVGWARLHRNNVATSYSHAESVESNLAYIGNANAHFRAACAFVLTEIGDVVLALEGERAHVRREKQSRFWRKPTR